MGRNSFYSTRKKLRLPSKEKLKVLHLPAFSNLSYDYFRHLITDKMLDDVTTQTNIHSIQKTGTLVRTTKKETETFIGPFLRMGLVKAYSVRSYWKTGTRFSPVADHMERDRFQELAATVYFMDNNRPDMEEKKTQRKTCKLGNWLYSFRKKSQEDPFRRARLDHGPFQGEVGHQQFMRGKLHLWGKGWNIWHSVRFRYPPMLSRWQETGTFLVGSWRENCRENEQNYKFFADNSNAALVKALKEKSMYFVGTFRASRLKGYHFKPESELKASGRSSCDVRLEMMSNILAV